MTLNYIVLVPVPYEYMTSLGLPGSQGSDTLVVIMSWRFWPFQYVCSGVFSKELR